MVALAGCGRVGFDRSGPGVATDGAGPATDAGPTVPAGARIWLEMETDPAIAILDSAGGHTVSCPTSRPARVAGKHGMGYRTTSSQLEIADAADLDPSNGFTAAIWVAITTYPPTASACAFGKQFSPSSDTFVMCIDPGGQLFFDSEDPAGQADIIPGPILARDTWHHLAESWDGTVKRGYVDGVEVGAHPIAIGHGNGTFNVGGDETPPGSFIDAIVDDAVYYTRALSQAEVAQLATP